MYLNIEYLVFLVYSIEYRMKTSLESGLFYCITALRTNQTEMYTNIPTPSTQQSREGTVSWAIWVTETRSPERSKEMKTNKKVM